MPLNVTDKEKRRESARRLGLMLALEALVVYKFSQLFKIISQDFESIYSLTGRVIDTSIYNNSILDILSPVYARAGREVSDTIRNRVKIPEDTVEVIDSSINQDVTNFVDSQPSIRTNFINQTTQKDLLKSVSGVIIGSALTGEALNNDQVASLASRRFLKKSGVRPDRIATAEALNAIEGVKYIESDNISKFQASAGILPGTLVRIWSAILDNVTRPTHFMAHGQMVLPGVPFRVGNSLLRYPGDTSLGASLEEIINCRCEAFTVIRE